MSGSFGYQVIDGVVAQVCLTVSQFSESTVSSWLPYSYFHGPQVDNWMWNTYLAESSHGFIVCGLQAIMVKKKKSRSPPLFWRIYKKPYYIAGGITMISTTIKYLNNAGIVVPVISPFNWPTGLLKKKSIKKLILIGRWLWTDYVTLTQGVAPTATTCMMWYFYWCSTTQLWHLAHRNLFGNCMLLDSWQ